jgi:RNA polymerase sigma-54 factor
MKMIKVKMFPLEIKKFRIPLKKKTRKPPDDQLAEILRKRLSYSRRTIAKYREQLDIPVARMRKKM